MMLTDEHERRARTSLEYRPANVALKSPARDPAGVAAAGLPGSLRGSADDIEQDGPPQLQLQSRTPRTNSTTNMHVLHGVKSGAWGMPANTELSFPPEQQ